MGAVTVRAVSQSGLREVDPVAAAWVRGSFSEQAENMLADAPRDWLVAADDRTGAFEVAALFAQVVDHAIVASAETSIVRGGVVDLGSRALTTDAAARLAGAVDARTFAWLGHKIDSTLRGHWAAELLARQNTTGRRVVVLPGWPEMNRTCVGGVVFVGDSPVGNVLDHLGHAELVTNETELSGWLTGVGTLVVCDIPSSGAMHSAASVLAGSGVLVAGPAGPLGAAFAAECSKPPPTAAGDGWGVQSPVLVVCGSANPIAREQIRRLRAALPNLEVIATSEPDGALRGQAVVDLAELALLRIETLQPQTIVLVGGDTAARVLGNGVMAASGFAAFGMPRICELDFRGPHWITKAGGFGGPNALVDLLGGENG